MGKIKINSNTSSRIIEPVMVQPKVEAIQLPIIAEPQPGKTVDFSKHFESVDNLIAEVEKLKSIKPSPELITIDVSNKLDVEEFILYKKHIEVEIDTLQKEMAEALNFKYVEIMLQDTVENLNKKIETLENLINLNRSDLILLKNKKEEVTKIVEKETVQEKIPQLAKWALAGQLVLNLILITILLTK